MTGRGGADLHQQWGQDPSAYLGITVPKFPNLFCIYGPNTNLVVNGSIVMFSECAVHYTMECLRLLLARYSAIEPSRDPRSGEMTESSPAPASAR